MSEKQRNQRIGKAIAALASAPKDADCLVRMLKAYACASRIMIMGVIVARDGVDVQEMVSLTGMGRFTLSYNVRVSVAAGLVETERDGNRIVAFASQDGMSTLRRLLLGE